MLKMAKVFSGLSVVQNIIRSSPIILQTLFVSSPLPTAVMLMCLLLQGLSSLVLIWLITHVVNSFVGAMKTQDGWLYALEWVGAWGAFTVANAAVIQLGTFCTKLSQRKSRLHLQRTMYQQVAHVPLSQLEDSQFLDGLRGADQAFSSALMPTTLTLTASLSALLSLVALGIVFAEVSYVLLILVILANIPTLVSKLTLSKDLATQQSSAQTWERKARYFEDVLTGERYQKEIKVYGASEFLIRQWQRALSTNKEAKINLLSQNTWKTAILQICSYALYAGGIGLMADLTWGGSHFSIGFFVAILSAIQNFQSRFDVFTSQVGTYSFLSQMTIKGFDFMASLQKDSLGERKITTQLEQVTIQFEKVSFRYPNSDRDAVAGLTLCIHPGEKIAIVGENGSGKSTFAKLLLGLYQPTSGQVLIDGKPLAYRDELLNQASAVFQDFAHYHFRFRENIGLGREQVLELDDVLLRAAEEVDLKNAILGSANQLDTQLGVEFTDGINLSGGQWQRLAIARGNIHESSFIVLDEPNSALDPIGELELIKRTIHAVGKRTALIISHRIGLARNVDRAFVFDNGKLVEQGTHEELMGQQGRYRELFDVQGQWYL